MTGSDQIDGQVGGCLDLDGTDDYIDFSNPFAYAEEVLIRGVNI